MTMKGCRRCRQIRLVLLMIVLGAGGGFSVLRFGGSRELSMLATFFGALLPLAWSVRKNRYRGGELK
ncbi:MAG: hypothetical protein KDI82_13120 [Gammaproteobacteria bacterium]|nr:hypothetical protein [Gammaproteobacteria bacterium]